MADDQTMRDMSIFRLWAIVLLTAGSLILLVKGAEVAQRVLSGQGLRPIETVEVDPGALREISGIGTVVAQTTEEPLYDHTVQVVNILIMDVGASSFEDASATARTALEERGWVMSGASSARYIDMTSPEWTSTSLIIQSVKDLAGYGAHVVDLVKGLPRANAYVLIDVSPLG